MKFMIWMIEIRLWWLIGLNYSCCPWFSLIFSSFYLQIRLKCLWIIIFREIGGEITQDGDFFLFESNRYRNGFLYKNISMSGVVSFCFLFWNSDYLPYAFFILPLLWFLVDLLLTFAIVIYALWFMLTFSCFHIMLT